MKVTISIWMLFLLVELLDNRGLPRRVLVIGPPGSGKSFLSRKLGESGFNAIDSDDLSGLSSWVDADGNRTAYQSCAGRDWLRVHRFVWDRAVLKDYVASSTDLYLFGVSDNIFEMMDLFDIVFYLDLNQEELLKRLMRVDRENPMGRTKRERKEIVMEMRKLRAKAKAVGLEIVDGSLSVERILSRICPDYRPSQPR